MRLLASIKNPFVCSYKEAFIDNTTDSLCIVMEYVDEGDLHNKIVKLASEGKELQEGEIWRIFIQMVFGLKSLHDLNIMHRDLKTANVFLGSNG